MKIPPRLYIAVSFLASVWIGATQFSLAHGINPNLSFEGRHTHSIGLTPNGDRLLALNSAEGRLSVFNVSDASNPVPILEMEIPVGVEPVSLRARTNDEVWVVNEVSDSVSIVSLGRGLVIATLQTPDEPADVVFAQGKAFVSCARNNLLRVFDATTRVPLASIPLEGNYPRALTTDPAGEKVFAAFLYSGNRTTLVGHAAAPAPPAPVNPALPPAPQTALIVAANDPLISYTVMDHDVAEVDAVSGEVVRYLEDVGTNLFDIAVHPVLGDPWVANSESRNLVRFESALRGHVSDHRLTRIDSVSGTPTAIDLNPNVDYNLLPNPVAQATALAQPTALVFTADGTQAWVAAFGSDRIAQVSPATGAVTSQLDLRSAGQTSRQMRGPRALALLEARQRLYVLNRISETISVVATNSATLVAEVPVSSYDPMAANIRQGRGFIFDARLSGNGTISCASCHIDADLDGLAWDLGDPAGDMVTVLGRNLSAHDATKRPRILHPMKGPMVTQTLRAIEDGAPFHWRGDRPNLSSFNNTFDKLMGGSQLALVDVNSMEAYLRSLGAHPNPNRGLGDTLPASLNGGDPVRGEMLFNSPGNHCLECHSDHSGAPNNIDLHSEVGSTQPVKNPPLRTVYQRNSFNPQPGAISRSGFGMLHDGSGFLLPTVHPYALDSLSTPADFADLRAFILCFDTGTRSETGASRTLTLANATDAGVLATLALLEQRTEESVSALVVHGRLAGSRCSFTYNAETQRYDPDVTTGTPLTLGAMLALLDTDDAITFISVPVGWAYRRGNDRDVDSIRNGDEAAPTLTLEPLPAEMRLQWTAAEAGWTLESTADLTSSWQTVTRPRSVVGPLLRLDDPIDNRPSQFYRLRRTW